MFLSRLLGSVRFVITIATVPLRPPGHIVTTLTATFHASIFPRTMDVWHYPGVPAHASR